jgi:hypothetical protein
MLLSAIFGLAVVLAPAGEVNARPVVCLLAQASPETKPAEEKPAQADAQSTSNPQSEPAKPDPLEPAASAEGKQSGPQPPPAAKTGTKRKPKPIHRKPPKLTPTPSSAADPAAGGEADKVVVRDGGTKDPVIQLTPTMTKQQASEKLNKAKQLLTTTESNLKQISNKQLAPADQETLKQIRTYMAQARTAVDQGDVEAAHNLALKAQLLSDDLVKR